MNLTDYRAVLRHAAFPLFVFALLEAAVFTYCVERRISFGSSVGMLGVFVGFFLMRGSLRAAAFAHRGALFILGIALPILVSMPWIVSLDLMRAVCRWRPLSTFVIGGYSTVLLALCWWTARRLNSESVRSARRAIGLTPLDRRYPFGIGAMIGLTAATVVGLTLNGRAAAEAERQAAERYGAEYRYRTIGLAGFHFIDDSVVFASVAMWNERELKVIEGPLNLD